MDMVRRIVVLVCLHFSLRVIPVSPSRCLGVGMMTQPHDYSSMS